jgi:hypothetical protein
MGEHEARLGEMRNKYKISVGRFEGKRTLREQGIDRRILLKWTLKDWCIKGLIGLIWLLRTRQ